MIPSPPSIAAIVDGMAYSIRMATRQSQPAAMLPTPTAIWDALWFRFILVLLNGIVMLGWGNLHVLPLLAVIGLVDTLSYPVVSQYVLQLTGLGRQFQQFILSVTWIGNLRVILLMAILLGTSGTSVIGNFLLFVAAIWMIWATWTVAAASLGDKKLAAVGAVLLMMVLEMINASVIINMIHPLVVTAP